MAIYEPSPGGYPSLGGQYFNPGAPFNPMIYAPYQSPYGGGPTMQPQSEGDGGNTDPGSPPPPPGPGPSPSTGTGTNTSTFVPYELDPAISRDINTQWVPPQFWQSYGNYMAQYPDLNTQIGAAMYSNIRPQQYVPPWAVQNLPGRLSGPGYLNGGNMGNYGQQFARWGPRELGNPYPGNGYNLQNMNVPGADVVSGMNYNPFTRNQNGNWPWGAPGGAGNPFTGGGNTSALSRFSGDGMSGSGQQGYGTQGMGPSYGGSPGGQYGNQYFGQPGGPQSYGMGAQGMGNGYGFNGGGYSPMGMNGGMQGNPFARGGFMPQGSPWGLGNTLPMGGYNPQGGSMGRMTPDFGGGMGSQQPQGNPWATGQFVNPSQAGMAQKAAAVGNAQFNPMNPMGNALGHQFGQVGSSPMGLRTSDATSMQPTVTGTTQGPAPYTAGWVDPNAASGYLKSDPYSQSAAPVAADGSRGPMMNSGSPVGTKERVEPGNGPYTFESGPNRNDPGSMSGLFGFFGAGPNGSVQQQAQNYANWYTQQYGNQAPGGPRNYYQP